MVLKSKDGNVSFHSFQGSAGGCLSAPAIPDRAIFCLPTLPPYGKITGAKTAICGGVSVYEKAHISIARDRDRRIDVYRGIYHPLLRRGDHCDDRHRGSGLCERGRCGRSLPGRRDHHVR